MSSASVRIVANPISAFIISFCTFTFTLGLTSRCSIIRPAAFPIMLICVWLAISTPQAVRFSHPMYPNLLGGSVFAFVLQYIDSVFLGRWTYEAKGPTSSRGGQRVLSSDVSARKGRTNTDSVPRRLWWAFTHPLNRRFCGQPWEVQNVAPFDRHNPKHVPGRAQFLWRNAVECAVCILLLDLSQSVGGNPAERAHLFISSRVPFFARLGNVTPEEVILRYATSIMLWTNAYILFELCYCGLAFVTVTMGVSNIESWHPMFGSLGDSWTLRQFWGYDYSSRPDITLCLIYAQC